MKTLITPQQVVQMAFSDGEFIAAEAVAESDIAAAEIRYLVPVIGHKLYARLLEGIYADFKTEYLAAPAALFTRILIQPALDIRTGQCGTVAPRSAGYQPAADASLRRLMRSLRVKARTLLRRASEHLSEHADSFPEYDESMNILKKCSLHGDFIQMH